MSAKTSNCIVMPVLAAGILTALTRPAISSAQGNHNVPQIIKFDAPEAATLSSPTCAPFCGTFPYAVNSLGVIVGFYTDPNIVPYGFLRTPDGHIKSFEAPGAGVGYGLNEGTVAYSLNDADTAAGQFQDSNYIFHGFVRYADGFSRTFDAPGAGTSANQGTFGEAINVTGEIAGYYVDANNVCHAFFRAPEGKITTFDAPGAGTNANQGTFLGEKAINPNGEIDGWYVDNNNVFHGFVRASDGLLTSFDPPGSQLTIVGGINPEGEITGYYEDVNSVTHGFLRARDGSFTTIDAPGAGTGNFQGTSAFSLNSQGAITGVYLDANYVFHGFLRYPDGTFATFDAPGAGTMPGQGTRPEFISAAGVIIGFYYDEQGLSHGFLRTEDSLCASNADHGGH